MKTKQSSVSAVRKAPRFVGVLLSVAVFVTAVPTLVLELASLRLNPVLEVFFNSNAGLSAVCRTVCFAGLGVNVLCVFAFLFLYLSDRLDKQQPVRRYLPAWIAIGAEAATAALLLLLLLLTGVFYAVSVFLLEHGM